MFHLYFMCLWNSCDQKTAKCPVKIEVLVLPDGSYFKYKSRKTIKKGVLSFLSQVSSNFQAH